MNATLTPIRKRYAELRDDEATLRETLRHGRERAAEVADRTLARLAAAMGFVPLPGPPPGLVA